MADKEILTLEEVADILRISVATARKIVESGELKAKKVRGQWRVRREDLDAYMAS
jgi:excisionase family DNA binding protein